MDKVRESSIDLQFPGLAPLLSPWRDANEAKGIPPHVSLLYPWRTPPLNDRDVDAVRATIANCAAFPITFSAIGRFPRKRVLYLKIENNVPLRTLMETIHGEFPETPPYRGEHPEVIPHLTIATADDDFALDRLEREVRLRLEGRLPLAVEAQSVIVAQKNPDGIWSTAAELPLSGRPFSTYLDTELGPLTIMRAGSADFDAVMAILREAADWLEGRGIHQWYHWYMDAGDEMLRDRLQNHEVYLFRLSDSTVGTLTIQWSDPEVWGERGEDGQAGYVHGMAIRRSLAGSRVGERMLEWAVATIRSHGRRCVRLDAMASNGALCGYYEQRGFRQLGTALLVENFTSRLFERQV